MKAGDVVVVYNTETRSIPGGYEWGPYSAKIVAVDQTWGTMQGFFQLEDFRGKTRFAHPNQCRPVEDEPKPQLSGAQ